MTGAIIVPSDVAAFRGAVAHVRLEDATFANGPAELVATTVLRDFNHAPPHAPAWVPFRLEVPSSAIDPSADYVVRVWIDIDGDGQRSAGDLNSHESHPVLTKGFGQCVEVEVRP